MEDSLLVVGLGMIGGSVLRSVRDASSAAEILGFDAAPRVMSLAYSEGVIDNNVSGGTPTDDFIELAEKASLIVIAVPPMSFGKVFGQLARCKLRADAVISDVASVKLPVIEACETVAPQLLKRFIPAHPIAGSEQSGLLASKSGLFSGKKLILTPHECVDDGAHRRGIEFWKSLDCKLAELSPKLHDELLASTSHLPHVLAYVLVDSLLLHPNIDRLFEFAAGGFQAISRTASSDPTMWHDIFFANKDAVLRSVEQFESRLGLFKQLLKEDRSDELFSMLGEAKQARDDYLKKYRS
ncbi:MAG: prephenate dehydrogenase [Pseudomonadales bacterium]